MIAFNKIYMWEIKIKKKRKKLFSDLLWYISSIKKWISAYLFHFEKINSF